MKPQQRPFVVEYKSQRRRSPHRANAIWEKVDLKTILREAEVDAPHLFTKQVVSNPAQSQVWQCPQVDLVSTHLANASDKLSIAGPVRGAISDEGETSNVPNREVQREAATLSSVTPNRALRRRGQRVARLNRASLTEIAAVEVPVDELDRLEK